MILVLKVPLEAKMYGPPPPYTNIYYGRHRLPFYHGRHYTKPWPSIVSSPLKQHQIDVFEVFFFSKETCYLSLLECFDDNWSSVKENINYSIFIFMYKNVWYIDTVIQSISPRWTVLKKNKSSNRLWIRRIIIIVFPLLNFFKKYFLFILILFIKVLTKKIIW